MLAPGRRKEQLPNAWPASNRKKKKSKEASQKETEKTRLKTLANGEASPSR